MNKPDKMNCIKILMLLMAAQPAISSARTISQEDICKASIATIMGRDPSIMKIDTIQGDVVYLSYIRSNDETRWSYKCKLDGSKVIWGNAEGRWRTEELVTFTVSGDTVTITDKTTSSTESFSFR